MQKLADVDVRFEVNSNGVRVAANVSGPDFNGNSHLYWTLLTWEDLRFQTQPILGRGELEQLLIGLAREKEVELQCEAG